MSPVSNRLSIQYLENYITDKKSDSNVGASAAASESFQSDKNQRDVYPRSKKHLQQKESSNDASNETSDCDNGGAHVQKPLTSRNLEAQNKGNGDSSENAVNNGDSSPRTSGPDGENFNGNSNGNSRITSEATSTSAEANVKPVLPKVFFCKICNQGFTRKHNMVSHEMIHTTVKLHSCKNCNLSFRRIHDLKRHEKLHTGEKPFHCVNCDRSFVRPDALTRHLNSPHACSGSKHNNESPQCTQTSNSSSSSYQASKRRQITDASTNGQKKLNHSSGAVKMLPSLADKFNDEQSLPLSSEFNTTSLLPTGEKAIFSDGDSGMQSSRVNRATIPGSLAGSNSGFYARLSPLTGDTNNTAHNKPNFEINRWRSQQMNKGEEVSENIMKDIVQKHRFSSNSTSVNSGGDELKALNEPKISNHPTNAPVYQQQHPASSNQQGYPHSFSPFHRSSASMASINKTVIQASSLKRPSFAEIQSASSAEKAASLSEVKNLQNDGISSQSGKEVIMPSQPSSSYRTGHDSFISGCQSNQPQCYASKSIIPSAPPFCNHATQSRSYIPMVSNQDDWQGPQILPFNSHAARPSSAGHWQDMNRFRFENHEQKEVFSMSSELVRAEAYHDLQAHTNTLQMRVSSLEQRMEMLEEKMKRDFKDNIKLQKRHERHEREERKSKKKSKKR